MSPERRDDERELELEPLTRRAVLRATGGAAALGVGTGAASAAGGDGPTTGQVGTAGVKNFVDPVFGFAAMGPNPCRTNDDCLAAFPQPIRPAAKVEMKVGIPGLVFGVAESGALSGETLASINEAAADGSLDGDTLPQTSVDVGGDEVPIPAVAQAVVETVGFYFEPAGIRAEPGDVLLFNASSPDHGVAAFHQGHGRQNRVPDGVGPISSPLVPVGGFWLAQFDEQGVYDLYCPPHGPFGMVIRVVVWDGDGAVPELEVGPPGRPPQAENALPGILGGLDPNVPSSAEALGSDALSPSNVVAEGTVSWAEVVEEHRAE